MKVLIATSHTQGLRADDYHFAVAGELVYFPILDCETPGCGCVRGFAGFASAKASTTAMVVDRPDLSQADFEVAVVDALSRQGWLTEGWSEEHEDLVETVIAEIEFVTSSYETNSLIEREGNGIRCRGIIHPEEHLGWAA